MTQIENLVIGLDIGEEFSQLCFFDEEKNDAEFLSETKEKKTYLLPNAIFLTEDMKWYFGRDALKKENQEVKGTLYDSILENTIQRNVIKMGEQEIKYESILLSLIEYYLTKLNKICEWKNIENIVFTLRKPNRDMVDLFSDFGYKIGARNVQVISYANSYLHFVFRQDKELWNNNIGMFDYGIYGMHYYQIDIARRTKPMQIRLKEQSIDAMPSTEDLEHIQDKVIDRLFVSQAKEVIGNNILSSVFLTGVGFLSDWLDESLKLLCSGRRVFKGQNLYAKGACYYGYYGEKLLKQDYHEMATGIIEVDIGIRAYYLQKEDLYPIILGGKEWYNTQGSMEVFLDNTYQIELFYRNIHTKEIRREVIEISDLPVRPNKTTKLHIDIEFMSQDKGAILIRDKGFGEWYPTTNKVYRKEFTL